MAGEFGVGRGGAFRHFQDQRSGRNGVGFHGRRQDFLETGIAQLPAGEIDAGKQGRRERKIALPMGQVLRRPFQREAAQLHDQSALLGMGDEFGRRDQAFEGWRQRSSASKPATERPASRMMG